MNTLDHCAMLSTVGLLTQNINDCLVLHDTTNRYRREFTGVSLLKPSIIILLNVNSCLKVLSQLEFFLLEVNPDKLSKTFCKCHND